MEHFSYARFIFGDRGIEMSIFDDSDDYLGTLPVTSLMHGLLLVSQQQFRDLYVGDGDSTGTVQ